MKKIGTYMLAVIIFGACESRKSAEEDRTDAPETEIAPPGDNQLSDGQKEEGWKLLFNGQNMDGWRTYKNRENDSWEVVNGTLHCKADSLAKKRADILTVDQ